MSTRFDRPLYGFRFVETLRGDSLQLIAARELGDAGRWAELIAYNNLVPPFITDDPAIARTGVVLTGSSILVPAPTPVSSSTIDPEEVFGTDVQLSPSGAIMIENGDFAVVSGRANLRQALKHRIETDTGELIYHVEYGSRIREIIGTANGPTAGLLAERYARIAVQADPRISSVEKSVADVAGDVVNVSVDAIPITGKPVQVSAQA